MSPRTVWHTEEELEDNDCGCIVYPDDEPDIEELSLDDIVKETGLDLYDYYRDHAEG